MSRFEDIQEALDSVSPVPIDLPRLYLLGDTGAGKTTIIRKTLGTEGIKFPTTRQTRTTVAPTEYVIRDGGDFDITVVFKPLSEVEGYVDEILKEAITKFHKDRLKEKIVKNLRQTSDQRFRLYYLLSNEFSESIAEKIVALIPLIDKKVAEYQKDFPEDKEETGIFVEFSINELSDNYNSIFSEILSEIQRMAASTCEGQEIDSSYKIYKYSNSSQEQFILKCKDILSSETNSISPLIEYARIRGSMSASWVNAGTEVVIIDGEGIGHDTKEAGQLSSRHYDYFYRSDAILLIEESKKPFVAGGKSALKSIFDRGYGEKLLVLFTKLDEVEPYDEDTPTNEGRIEEVKDGLTNVLASLKEEGQEINLSDSGIFYLGGLHEDSVNEDAVAQINSILSEAQRLSTFTLSFIKPKYDFEMLSAFLVESTKKFNQLYQDMLNRQHWKTIEAFNRRMDMGIDGFRMFTPITDFEEKINDEIKDFISKPISWEEEVSDKLKRQSLDNIRREFNKLILDFARRQIISMPNEAWNTAYLYSGRGSTFKRRADIKAIFKKSVPPLASSENVKEFKDHVKQILAEAIVNCEKA